MDHIEYFQRQRIIVGVMSWLNSQKANARAEAEKDDEFFESVKRFCVAVAINNINNKTETKPKKVTLTRFDFSKN